MSFWEKMTEPRPINTNMSGVGKKESRKKVRITKRDYLLREIKMLKDEITKLREINKRLYDKMAERGIKTDGDGLHDILVAVSKHYDISVGGLQSVNRSFDYRNARCVFAIIGRANGYTYKRIGQELGGRDHSTIMNLIDKSRNYLSDKDYDFIQSF